MHIKRINLNCSKQTIKRDLLRPLDYENIQSLFDSKLWLYVVTSIIVKESFTQKLQFAENFLPLKSSKMYNKLVFFFFSSEQIWRNVSSLAHQWIICSEWVPSEWESKQLIKALNADH